MPKVEILDAPKRLDASNVDAFKQRALGVLEEGKVIVVDFSDTTFIDSVGLGCLVSLLKRAASRDGAKVVLCSLTPQVTQIFEMTRLYRLFDVFDTKEDVEAAV